MWLICGCVGVRLCGCVCVCATGERAGLQRTDSLRSHSARPTCRWQHRRRRRPSASRGTTQGRTRGHRRLRSWRVSACLPSLPCPSSSQIPWRASRQRPPCACAARPEGVDHGEDGRPTRRGWADVRSGCARAVRRCVPLQWMGGWMAVVAVMAMCTRIARKQPCTHLTEQSL
jgi:hypothetical protein